MLSGEGSWRQLSKKHEGARHVTLTVQLASSISLALNNVHAKYLYIYMTPNSAQWLDILRVINLVQVILKQRRKR